MDKFIIFKVDAHMVDFSRRTRLEKNKISGSQFPENAFTELKEGEEYQPVMSPDKAYPEVNGWSVTWGVLMAILFPSHIATTHR